MIVKDLQDGKDGENKVKEALETLGYKCEFNEDKKQRSFYDLVLNESHTLEVKNDLYATKSGNVAIEYYNPKSDKPSGINITKSDIWCHIIGGEIFVVKTNTLKMFMESEKPFRTIEKVGDGNASIKLYKLEHIMTVFIPIEKIGDLLCGLGKRTKQKPKKSKKPKK